MTGQDWVEKVKQYRIAVDAYCEVVDRMDNTGVLAQEWQRTEAARDAVERARSALLRDRRQPVFAHERHAGFEETPAYASDEWVLGDLGQFGG